MRQQSQFQAFQYPGSLGEHPNSVAADPGVRMLFLLLFTVALVSDGWGREDEDGDFGLSNVSAPTFLEISTWVS